MCVLGLVVVFFQSGYVHNILQKQSKMYTASQLKTQRMILDLKKNKLKNLVCNKQYKTWTLVSHPWTFYTFKSVTWRSPDLPI